ncbi:uncharacterized protein EAF01_004480 [Botrytis porri]|uniref:uncharacterized protein n=1 Tax=Botrytis porri TaxID=87229 RepID=UPI001901DCD5|nr:uncharacterized protein EAF01_004480 [Botrytis porri]KAF7908725.1 hypothetical protein EAF01_004480 [Botrytis porri]
MQIKHVKPKYNMNPTGRVALTELTALIAAPTYYRIQPSSFDSGEPPEFQGLQRQGLGWCITCRLSRRRMAHRELRRQLGWQATGIRTDSDEAVRISITRT